MKQTSRLLAVLVLGLSLYSLAFADAGNPSIPPCEDERGNELGIINDTVLLWKTTTPNQTLKRAHISGVIQKLFPDHNGHTHFEAKIGPNTSDTLEVIYNMSFGLITHLAPGMTVEACGDYITSNAPASGYQASPDGAIIHWIHRTNNPNKHKGGFLVIEGTLYGMGPGNGNDGSNEDRQGGKGKGKGKGRGGHRHSPLAL